MREQMHVRIVPMTGDHLDEVAELERICFTTPWSRNMLVEELQNDCAAFLVALDDEDHVAATPACWWCWTRGTSPMCRAAGVPPQRHRPEAAASCSWTLPRPTSWRF